MSQGSAENPGEVVAKKSNAVTSKAEVLAQRIEATKKNLEDLKRKKKAIDQRQRLMASKAARKADARKKILVGAMLLAEIEDDAGAAAQLQARLDAYLTRDDDRAVFGLPPKGQQPPRANHGLSEEDAEMLRQAGRDKALEGRAPAQDLSQLVAVVGRADSNPELARQREMARDFGRMKSEEVRG